MPVDTKFTVDKKFADLTAIAESTLNQLLVSDELKIDQWMVRLSALDVAGPWELMTNDSAANNQLIKDKLGQSEKPVTELSVAYVGTVHWRGKQERMAYLQYYRSGHELGLLCLRRLKEESEPGKVEAIGGLLIGGACKNIWI